MSQEVTFVALQSRKSLSQPMWPRMETIFIPCGTVISNHTSVWRSQFFPQQFSKIKHYPGILTSPIIQRLIVCLRQAPRSDKAPQPRGVSKRAWHTHIDLSMRWRPSPPSPIPLYVHLCSFFLKKKIVSGCSAALVSWLGWTRDRACSS